MLTAEKWIPLLFREWGRNQIRYAVLRNYERLPHETGNDLDVLVSPGRRADAVEILRTCVTELGGMVHQEVPFSCTSVFFHDPVSKCQFHVDVFDHVAWRFFPLLDADDVLRHARNFNGIQVLSKADEALLNLFNHLLHGAGIREKYQPQILSAAAATGFAERLAKLIGKSLSARTREWIRTGRWQKIERRRNLYRLKIGMHALLHAPFRVMGRCLLDIGRFIERLIHPPGLFVVMVGPDGSGKTTAGRTLQEKLAGTFYIKRSRYYHWKARLVKQETVPTGPPRQNPHGEPLRSRIGSVLYFLAHIVDLVVAHWIKIHPALFKNGLVLVDRYYYDFFVDPRRYRLQLPAPLPGWVYKWVPKPDLVFFFDAPPDVLQSRKKEVSYEECMRQRDAYLELSERLPQAVVMDADQPADHVADAVQEEVLAWLSSRRGKRSGK